MTFAGNPIDHLEALARAGVPVLHVVGDADDVVPAPHAGSAPHRTVSR